nr:peptidylprolyl isomerase [Candidatus Nitrosopelagicus sp.]
MNKKFFLIPLTLLIIALTPQVLAENNDSVVVLETESGDIVIEFFFDDAPNHVDNFLKLSKDGVYDGTVFHRIISGFMIQGGDPFTAQAGVSPSKWGTGDPGYSIDSEFNDIVHERGIVSMARSNDPNSAGSQFFIVHQDSTFLDGQYTIFGRIITQESFETLDKIAGLETLPNDQAIKTSFAIVNKVTIKDRSEISSILDLKPPTRTNTQVMSTDPELYTNNYLGISFESPVGWLIQSPPKTDSDTPDLVVLGTQTPFSSPAITLNIDRTSGTTQTEMEKLQKRLSPLITQNVLTITSEDKTTIDGNPAYVLRAQGKFENQNDQVREVGFTTILFVDDNRVYTLQYTNNLSDYAKHIDTVDQVFKSFKLIHSGPSSSENSQVVTSNEEGGGCLIATAAFGSEMAPQ